jgi:Spy/CpxP family protein refolding chaperone
VKPGVTLFLLGLILGAVAGSWGQREHFRRALHAGPEDHRRRMLERLNRDLALDEKQKTAVAAIMDSKKADIDKVKADAFDRLEAIRKSADAEMAKVLTPEQAAKLEAMHRKARPMRLIWEAPPPPPPPPAS